MGAFMRWLRRPNFMSWSATTLHTGGYAQVRRQKSTLKPCPRMHPDRAICTTQKVIHQGSVSTANRNGSPIKRGFLNLFAQEEYASGHGGLCLPSINHK